MELANIQLLDSDKFSISGFLNDGLIRLQAVSLGIVWFGVEFVFNISYRDDIQARVVNDLRYFNSDEVHVMI